MRKMRRLNLVIVLILISARALATEDGPEVAQMTVAKMARETVDCAAYFDIVSLALLHSADQTTAEKYLRARKLAVARADSLSRGIVKTYYDGVIKEMTQKIIIANVNKKINGDLSNLSITDVSVLGDQYSKLCKEVVDDPGARARYWKGQLSQ